MCQGEFDRHREAEYLPGIALASRLLAELHIARGDLARADAALAEGRAAAERMGDVPSLACLLGVWMLRHYAAGEHEAGDKMVAEGLAACRTLGEAWSRMWFALALVEGSLYGVAAEALAAAERLLDGLPDSPLCGPTRVTLAAARAFVAADAGPPHVLRAGAQALASETMGDRRAVQTIVGQLFVAEAALLDGDIPGAMASAAGARDAARSLGYTWLENAARRFPRRIADGTGPG
jgi:hypothetical protein